MASIAQTGDSALSARVSRRSLIQAGAAGMLGLSLPELLRARAQAAYGSAGSSEKSCILIVLSGGPSHIDTFDPKPAAPAEIRGLYRSIPTRTPGAHLSEMFPRLAAASPHYCLVRTLRHDRTAHVTAAHTMLTGQPDGSRKNESPLIGSLVAKFRPAAASVPSYVWLHNMKTGTNKIPRYNNGLHRIGYGYAPMRIGYELDNPAAPDFQVRHFDPPEGVTRARLRERSLLLQHLEQSRAVAGEDAAKLATFRDRAWDLLTSDRARAAFDLRHEPPQMRDRYGRHPLGQYSLMARRLIEAGVRLVTLTAWPGLAPGETTPTVTQVWDTHGIRYRDGDSMYGNGPFGMKWSLPRLDQAVATLLEDLAERNMLDDTLVAVVGEFGRTPKFENGGKGRGHWPFCYTGLLAGAGVRGGAVYGSSDKHGAYPETGRPLSQADFGATLFHALGIPPETRYGRDGFSFRASDGRPLREIFG